MCENKMGRSCISPPCFVILREHSVIHPTPMSGGFPRTAPQGAGRRWQNWRFASASRLQISNFAYFPLPGGIAKQRGASRRDTRRERGLPSDRGGRAGESARMGMMFRPVGKLPLIFTTKKDEPEFLNTLNH